MNRIQKVLGSVAVTAIVAVLPFAASANTLNSRANASGGVVISASGIVHVIGASVTAVSNGVINAVTTLGTTVINWIVNTSSTTKVSANGSANASTTDIAAGDKANFTGTLSSGLGSSITVAASKVRDVTTFPKTNSISGKVTSVNTGNSSFALSIGNHSVIVQTNASTTIMVNGATSTIASLQAGEQVKVAGTLDASGSVITASKVVVNNDNGNNSTDEEKSEGKGKVNEDHGNSTSTEKRSSSGFFQDIFAHLRIGVGN